MQGLSFLANITLASNEEVRPAFSTSRSTRSSVNKIPQGMKIRVFKNGEVFPSKELVETFHLEYTPKDSEAPSFGLDVMTSSAYPNTAHLTDKFIIVGITPKSAGKIDLFGSTKYVTEADTELLAEGKVIGDNKSSVLDQGAATFGKTALIPMLKEVYGFEFAEDQKFVDLEIIVAYQLINADGNYFIPKLISKGDKAGELSSVVRKDIQLFPLAISETTETEVEDKVEAVPQAEVDAVLEDNPVTGEAPKEEEPVEAIGTEVEEAQVPEFPVGQAENSAVAPETAVPSLSDLEEGDDEPVRAAFEENENKGIDTEVEVDGVAVDLDIESDSSIEDELDNFTI